MTTREALVRLLADGEYHSGEALVEELGMTRAAVWKQIKHLRGMGLQVSATAGKGYRLSMSLELLNERAIRQAVKSDRLASLEIFHEIVSTNTHLLNVAPPPSGRASVVLAEFQSRARGRKGRSWIAPFGSGVCLSVGWQFAEQPPDFSALTLGLGVAVIRALRRLGVREVQLKWPNDVIWGRGKLAGILTELQGESMGPAYVVAGIGVNVRLPAHTQIGGPKALPPVDLHAVCDGRPPSRNALAVALVAEVVSALAAFGETGFESFYEEWRAADGLAHAPVELSHGGEVWPGVARSIDRSGALLFERDGRTRAVISGELSLRSRQTP